MVSFQDIRNSKSKLSTTVDCLQSWPVKKYLDSGVFQFVRRAGTTRIRVHGASMEPVTWDEFASYVRDYVAYLRQSAYLWDYIVELDVDEVFANGVEIAAKCRRNLREIIGERLLPAWHIQRGHDGWAEHVREFPYVAIGSDKGVATLSAKDPALPFSYVRQLVREAHAQGAVVHSLGDTRLPAFIESEIDTGDSTSWLRGDRFGFFPGRDGNIQYTLNTKTKIKPQAMSKHRGFEDALARYGLTVEELRSSYKARFKLGALMYLERQKEIRNARQGTPLAS